MPDERFEMIAAPERFVAGELVTVSFRYVVGAEGLARGDELKLSLPSAGWGEPLVNHKRMWDMDPSKANRWLHYMRLNTTFEVVTDTDAFLEPYARFEQRPDDDRCIQRWWITFRVIEADFAPGDEIRVTYGDPTWGEAGGRVQPVIEPRGDFSLFVHGADGSAREAPGSPVWVEVEAGPPSRAFLRIPTVTADGDEPTPRAYVTDACCNPPAGEVPRIEVGIERAGDVRRSVEVSGADGMLIESQPSLVRNDVAEQVFWGDIHGKTGFSGDGLAPIDDYISYARDWGGADFTAVSDHSGCNRESWFDTQKKAAEYTVDGEFVALKGFEYSYAHGHRNVYFDNHRIEEIWPGERLDLDAGPNGLRPFFEYLRSRKDELISIPHHTMVWTDWDVFDHELERVCEIYSMWGCTERPISEGNPLWDKSCIPGGGAQAGLARGYRYGFIAASDSHSGFPGRQHPDLYGFCFSYKSGLAAIRAPELNAKSLIDSLKSRNCYATTGARIYVEFAVNDARMGSEITGGDPRRITGRVVGTDAIARVDIVRDNADWLTLTPGDDDVTIDATDDSPLGAGSFYYLRVTQADGEMAWASPVWIDPA